jgi:hypothetical protein
MVAPSPPQHAFPSPDLGPLTTLTYRGALGEPGHAKGRM